MFTALAASIAAFNAKQMVWSEDAIYTFNILRDIFGDMFICWIPAFLRYSSILTDYIRNRRSSLCFDELNRFIKAASFRNITQVLVRTPF